MAEMNIAICDNVVPNQGTENCNVPPAPLSRAIRIQPNEVIPASFWLTPEASLRAKFLNDNVNERWFPTPRCQDVTETIQETATATAADGSIFTLKEGSSNYQFLLKDSNVCSQAAMRSFDGSKQPWLLVQNNNVILGQKSNALTSPYALQMTGYRPQRVYVPKATLRTFADVQNSMLLMNFIDPKKDEANMVPIMLPDLDLDALMDECVIKNVYVQLSAALTVTGVVKFKLYSGCGNVNLGQAYPTELNSAALFTFINGTTGGTLAKTLALNATTGEFTMTATTPPAASTPMIIGLVAVNTLAAAGLEYYETPAHRLDGTVNTKSFKLTVINI